MIRLKAAFAWIDDDAQPLPFFARAVKREVLKEIQRALDEGNADLHELPGTGWIVTLVEPLEGSRFPWYRVEVKER